MRLTLGSSSSTNLGLSLFTAPAKLACASLDTYLKAQQKPFCSRQLPALGQEGLPPFAPGLRFRWRALAG